MLGNPKPSKTQLKKYRNYPFFVVEIFSHSTCYQICYTNIFPVQIRNYLIGNIFGWLRPSEINSVQYIFTRKLKERKKANYGN